MLCGECTSAKLRNNMNKFYLRIEATIFNFKPEMIVKYFFVCVCEKNAETLGHVESCNHGRFCLQKALRGSHCHDPSLGWCHYWRKYRKFCHATVCSNCYLFTTFCNWKGHAYIPRTLFKIKISKLNMRCRGQHYHLCATFLNKYRVYFQLQHLWTHLETNPHW